MKTSDAEHIRDLIMQRDKLLELIGISENYDFELFAMFHSVHNDNRSKAITKGYTPSKEIKQMILQDVKDSLQSIENELSNMELVKPL